MRLLIAKLASASVQSVSVALNSETDVADLASDLDSCAELLRAGEYDLVLLIVSQSKLKARDAITRLRREAGSVPMVVLTEPGGNEASLAGGMAHAPGHRLISPISPIPETVIADTTHVPWRWDEPPPILAETGRSRLGHRKPARRVLLDTHNELLRIDDQTLGLSQAEFRIFRCLWERRPQIVSAEELMDALYSDGERPASRVLPVFLFKLRRKLSALGLGDMIETAIGRGFSIRNDAEAESQHA